MLFYCCWPQLITKDTLRISAISPLMNPFSLGIFHGGSCGIGYPCMYVLRFRLFCTVCMHWTQVTVEHNNAYCSKHIIWSWLVGYTLCYTTAVLVPFWLHCGAHCMYVHCMISVKLKSTYVNTMVNCTALYGAMEPIKQAHRHTVQIWPHLQAWLLVEIPVTF